MKFYRADVSKRQDCFDVVDEIVRDFGKVNYLYNAVAFFKSSVSAVAFSFAAQMATDLNVILRA